ncbi:hypothetical protein PFISCL1PPCAC_9426, partial [Pristionchus fissidentatus]
LISRLHIVKRERMKKVPRTIVTVRTRHWQRRRQTVATRFLTLPAFSLVSSSSPTGRVSFERMKTMEAVSIESSFPSSEDSIEDISK